MVHEIAPHTPNEVISVVENIGLNITNVKLETIHNIDNDHVNFKIMSLKIGC